MVCTTTAVLQDIDNSNTNLTSSGLSSTNTSSVQKRSSAITMPTTGHQIDTNITAVGTSGEIDASRILVQVGPEVIPENWILLLLLSPLLWFGVLKMREKNVECRMYNVQISKEIMTLGQPEGG